MNNEKPQNPSAFPIQTDMVVNYGMTLRDYFAAKAMQAIINTKNYTFVNVAETAYKQADAMLKQREK